MGGLRAAPAVLVGGAAGQAAGVSKLLEAYVNLVAVQVSGKKMTGAGEGESEGGYIAFSLTRVHFLFFIAW